MFLILILFSATNPPKFLFYKKFRRAVNSHNPKNFSTKFMGYQLSIIDNNFYNTSTEFSILVNSVEPFIRFFK
ncbi:MAG: hypothetical protein A2913_01165 [Parcubacteria group bacterium RIFCSPLOWO2_01_FULL_40_65]|nr:MAG: hypothetical protein A2734_00810 [Parcubacteria group bacterium RIFCSPHIGHO2_01_FULL_40_30]OHB19494.1 MAG: hypothetical protein A3D40_02530 [Parcubacteria group bacterium RIFCSPHIGHO2_02_FULL_40_12]OHB22097.1 MAG: hypothetical protein A2913_01165 [Parcubacteria group bacterium RIFCSPLOWO2_01_FULL_40_65]OHB23692.1 MAG: hypothetical protein A3I22_02565 [Parcubacteria group bacterium RIFCSPLOWO2_02_FULL_40_12]OHB24389.1 MAG: hypothetical protein A3F96_00755 [Parcubacteria group bacterium R